MTPYYILAPTFGFSLALLSAYAIWIRKDKEDFPGSLYIPLMLLGVAFAIATLTFVTIGGNKEVKERKEHKAEKTAAAKTALVTKN